MNSPQNLWELHHVISLRVGKMEFCQVALNHTGHCRKFKRFQLQIEMHCLP